MDQTHNRGGTAFLITVARTYHEPPLVRDAAESDTVGMESESITISMVVEPIMVMSMERGAYPQPTGQFVDLKEAMWMATRSLMCYEDICVLIRKLSVIRWEDGATMLAWQPAPP